MAEDTEPEEQFLPETLEEEITPQAPLPKEPIPHETAAYRVALIVVVGFLILLGAPLLLYLLKSPPDVIDIIKTESSVLSGIVGAVVGYYYRGTQTQSST